MLTVLLALAVAQTPTHRLFKQPNLPTASLAFFEAFPSSGAGTTTACSTTAPTGARGEVLTFTRTGNGTCTRTATGGLATTGIADGDLVVLSGNVARVEYDSAGTLGLLVESARTNSLPRYNDLTNAAWSDVGTPTVTDGATDPFGGTSGDTITDNDGAAYEGRAQTISVSAGAAYFGHCYVKAGTATTARITVDGTAGTITGLSATTWSIVEVADASASGASVVVQVMVGNATTVTGTVVFGGCQVEAGATRSSIIPTVAAAVVRNVEDASFTTSGAIGPTMCLAASAVAPATGLLDSVVRSRVGGTWTNSLSLYRSGASLQADINQSQVQTTGAIGTGGRVAAYLTGSTFGVCFNGTCSTAAQTQSRASGVQVIKVGGYDGVQFFANGIISRIQMDPDVERCTR